MGILVVDKRKKKLVTNIRPILLETNEKDNHTCEKTHIYWQKKLDPNLLNYLLVPHVSTSMNRDL